MLTTHLADFLRLTLVIATAVVFCCAPLKFGAAQTLQRSGPIIVEGSNNETTKAELDLLAEKAGKDKLIILIARLGRAEYSRRLSQQRLRTVRDYLRFTRAVLGDRLVTAEGERASDIGRVEAYVDGKLFMVFRLRRNKNFAPEP